MPDLRRGEVLGGRYEILEQLGTGGMARVYRAHDPILGRDVAVKVLAERYASDPAFVERFRREASSAAGLNHPNIVQVFDRGEASGTYYIVMELLNGPDLKSEIRSQGPLPADRAIEVALQILAALAVAHRNDVIHRDVKPQNVMRGADGAVKVTDFGIARAGAHADVTEAGSVIGTAQYLSPEQARGGEVTPASDCYAVGIVLYEMLTGRPPFDGERPVTIAMKQINEPPVAPRAYEPSIPQPLEDVVMRALQKRPSERFRSADEFRSALLAVRARLDGTTAATTTIPIAGDTGGATRVMDAPTQVTRVAPPPQRRQPVPPPEPRRRGAAPWVVLGILLIGAIAIGALVLHNMSGGSPKVAVPDNLAGLTAEQATQRLSAVGLDAATTTVTSTAEQKNQVVGTQPSAGTRVAKNSTVTLQIGGGPKTTAVPPVVGKNKDDASTALIGAGFQPKVQLKADDKIPVDQVISQNPPANAQLAPAGVVTIVVSSGPGKVAVKDVRRLALSTATEVLAAQGLNAGNITERFNSDYAPGTVLDQNPAPTTRVDKGSSVDLLVARKPEQVAVPPVIGFDATQAVSKLRTAGFHPTTEGVPDAAPKGQVIDQQPTAGTMVDPGSGVSLTVSEGPSLTTTSPSTPGTSTGAQTPQGVPSQ
ncbi:MAG: Stk1 family PASTA domain-containing Ser/Thr kinase [Thermoleophilia bacterium]